VTTVHVLVFLTAVLLVVVIQLSVSYLFAADVGLEFIVAGFETYAEVFI